ncbi:MAG: hypothetical protein AB2462_08835 [Thermoanaerobacter sp.]|uniref:hypothetical protein n=1 Tax=Thermoanaerobacter sp. TaxID=1755 RepID=UPI0034641F22
MERLIWVDHVVDEQGNIVQQGTPLSARNLNRIEDNTWEIHEISAVLTQQVMQHKRLLADLEGEVGQVTLTNTQAYPFNNSKITVALVKPRDTLNYTVQTEIISAAGIPGDIKISDKQLNGFKIEFTGSATSVTVKYIVRGGMYQ